MPENKKIPIDIPNRSAIMKASIKEGKPNGEAINHKKKILKKSKKWLQSLKASANIRVSIKDTRKERPIDKATCRKARYRPHGRVNTAETNGALTIHCIMDR